MNAPNTNQQAAIDTTSGPLLIIADPGSGKGFHCLSAWDGSHTGMVREVKAGLRDPDSFEHVDTLITPVQAETGMHGVTMTFRARNGFGGLNLGTAIGEVDPTTCIVRNVLVDG